VRAPDVGAATTVNASTRTRVEMRRSTIGCYIDVAGAGVDPPVE
jgi:hypothetical protein